MAKNGISNHQTGFYIFVVSAHFSPRGIMLRITGIAQEIDTNLLRHFFLKILMHNCTVSNTKILSDICHFQSFGKKVLV